MGLADVTRSPIADVEVVGPCKFRNCERPMVKVTFQSGRTLNVHDDGSFVAWLGESNGGE